MNTLRPNGRVREMEICFQLLRHFWEYYWKARSSLVEVANKTNEPSSPRLGCLAQRASPETRSLCRKHRSSGDPEVFVGLPESQWSRAHRCETFSTSLFRHSLGPPQRRLFTTAAYGRTEVRLCTSLMMRFLQRHFSVFGDNYSTRTVNKKNAGYLFNTNIAMTNYNTNSGVPSLTDEACIDSLTLLEFPLENQWKLFLWEGPHRNPTPYIFLLDYSIVLKTRSVCCCYCLYL